MTADQTTKKVRKNPLVADVKKLAANKLKGDDLKAFQGFLNTYLEQFPLEEWDGRDASDLCGMCFGLWHFLQEPPAGEAKIHVFNPNLDVHGWLCGRTVITVLQKDMPFIVDSIRIGLNRIDLPIHVIKSSVLFVDRTGSRISVSHKSGTKGSVKSSAKEALIYLEVSLHTSKKELKSISELLANSLRDVVTIVDDYAKIKGQLTAARENIAELAADYSEETAFLSWLPESHFTFLGYRDFSYVQEEGETHLKENIKSRLGVFRSLSKKGVVFKPEGFTPGMKTFHEGDSIICFSKSATRSNVHRDVYPDYIVLKKYDKEGNECGEVRFLGLFTYAVYSLTPTYIPFLRRKFSKVLELSGLDSESHDGKNLCRVMDNFPRDELFQSDIDTLYRNVVTATNINERQVVRLIIRNDPFGHFVYCMVFIPREVFTTRIRILIQELIGEALGSNEFDSTTYFSESILVRAQFVFRVDPEKPAKVDVSALEKSIVDITRNWDDHLRLSLIERVGEAEGLKWYYEFKTAFSDSYREDFGARTAVHDISMIARLKTDSEIAMNFYQSIGAEKDSMRFKVMHTNSPLELSDVIPILENLGLRVLGENPYKIKLKNGVVVWLHDFQLRFALPVNINVEDVRELFESAFASVWRGEAENDDFNRLVLGAGLSWREVALLRTYAAYMKQTAFGSTKDFVADTLASHHSIAQDLIRLIKLSFSPLENKGSKKSVNNIETLKTKIVSSLDAVANLNEDRVLRRYLELIQGTLRTNFFQKGESGEAGSYKPYISIKFSPRSIPNIPKPRPLYEIFVYSPRVEGVHLRGGKVARGGLRWSDRLQDYRTEVLGLVKAQQVKNAVIVPSGAKGGFVAKQLRNEFSREEFFEEGIACYKLFIQGLLDITDNLVDGSVKPPVDCVRLDEDDPYLVVAADKGTATFSDIANEISHKYGHWLGDAFASGGSNGYDHKGMGITAKGAWVSVQRHFREKGLDIQKEDFSVIGVGDMAGDVFGNGMLLSEHICLNAAFNHMHIFIDPCPNAERSFVERKRLFDIPRATWKDYDPALISAGGGVFLRSEKSISITPQMKKAFDIQEDKLSPNDLIHALLKAPVDLIWNGGIGTYVKSISESHSEAGDKANDSLRVNGEDLRCKVFGEGGNLGMTQLGRVEFSKKGGACNTDFIDNAAGVDCSDHEVNIKILLDELVVNGDLTGKQRNRFLSDMTDSVSELVLENNYRQTQAISVAEFQVKSRVNEYRRFLNYLEATGRLDRPIEFLPTDEEIVERSGQGVGLTRPELSVLISYAKVMLKDELADSNLADDKYIAKAVETAFPNKIRKKYKNEIYAHRLKKEIVATQVANDFINNMGITAGHRLLESTGASLSDVAKAYVVSRDVFQLEDFQTIVKSLDNKVPAEFQAEIILNIVRRVRRGSRWFLRNRRAGLNPEEEVKVFKGSLEKLHGVVGKVVSEEEYEHWETRKARLVERGLDARWASRLSMPDNLFSGLGVVEASLSSGSSIESVARVHYSLIHILELNWFASQLSDVKVESYWQAMARESYIDDLESQLRKLCINILRLGEGRPIDAVLASWQSAHGYLVDRWRSMVNEVQGHQVTDYAMFSVAMRELIDLAQATEHCEKLEMDTGK